MAEFTNSGTSVYHEIQGLFSRDLYGNLLHISGPLAPTIQSAWSNLGQIYASDVYTYAQATSGQNLTCVPLPSESAFVKAIVPDPSLRTSLSFTLYESQRPNEAQCVGLIRIVRPDSGINPLFADWYIRLVLEETRLSYASMPCAILETGAKAYAQAIVECFERDLRNIALGDMWDCGGGRDYFTNKVLFFTSRMAPVNFSLPAFPCKSSNPQKVTGTEPDKGEELAIRSLANFVHNVRKVYPPGAKVLIVSDGHVFSDCIGVNDDIVDNYNNTLLHLTSQIIPENREQPIIEFCGLEALFFNNSAVTSSFRTEFVSDVQVKHYVSTKLTENAEVCRQVLIAGSQIDSTALRTKIDSGDSSTLALYRGFSRFMLDDLMCHPSVDHLGRNKRKKLASQVAFEMIIRNQAYSNLLELLLPVHVRLSIHAHVNSGPKFGISLLPRGICRTLGSLDAVLVGNSTGPLQDNTDDLLHLPTPWHNSVAQITGSNDSLYYLVKSKLVQDAMSRGLCQAEWVPGGGATGGYWSLTSNARVPGADITMEDMSESICTKPLAGTHWFHLAVPEPPKEGNWTWTDQKVGLFKLGWDVFRDAVHSYGFL